MSRDVEYSEDEKCDICGELGAWDFMGDLICPSCSEKHIITDEEGYHIGWND